jgi:gamma-butyrobetaine dioxygenase
MKIVSVDANQRAFKITWEDGSNSELPFIWLRDNDPGELHPETRERIFDLCSVDLAIKPSHFLLDSAQAANLLVRWPDREDDSKYTAAWLYEHRPGLPRPDPARIDAKSWAANDLNALPRFDAKNCNTSRQALLEALQSLKTQGIVLIENLDDESTAGEQFGDLIGFKRESNYGIVFEVMSKPHPNNLAYTSLALPLHTDLANQEFVPGNQFLHCYRNETIGGGSIFADALSVIDEFKQQRPEFYRLLSELPVPWHFVDEESDIRYHRPVIGLSRDGAFKGLTFNAHLADVPDFTPDLMYDFYAAYRELMLNIRTTKHKIETNLKNGEMVIFDNQRILHGRAAFEASSGIRHLRGYYIEHNEVDNRIRMLSKQLQNSN